MAQSITFRAILIALGILLLSNFSKTTKISNTQSFQDYISSFYRTPLESLANFQVDLSCRCGRDHVGNLPSEEFSVQQQHPWLVQVNTFTFSESDTLAQRCVGTIINSEFIITNAHCAVENVSGTFQVVNPSQIFVEWGITEDDIAARNWFWPMMAVKLVKTAPNYESLRNLHIDFGVDVALLQIQTPLDFSAPYGPRPVCLDPLLSEKLILQKPAININWDYFINTAVTPISIRIRKISSVQKFSDCMVDPNLQEFMRSRDESDSKMWKIYLCFIRNYYCSTSEYFSERGLRGDSGSPLLQNRTDNTQILVGMVSGAGNEFEDGISNDSKLKTDEDIPEKSWNYIRYVKVEAFTPLIRAVVTNFGRSTKWCSTDATNNTKTLFEKEKYKIHLQYSQTRVLKRLMETRDKFGLNDDYSREELDIFRKIPSQDESEWN